MAGRTPVPSRRIGQPDVMPLWPHGVPGVEGDRPGQGRADADDLAAPGRASPPARRWWSVRAAATDAGGGPRGEAGRRVAQLAGDRGVRAQVPAGPALPPSGDAPGRRPRDPDGARQARRVEARPAQDRDPGVLGRRAPGLDGRHPFRRGQARRRGPDRARQLAAGPDDPGLSGHRAGDALRSYRVAAGTCWATSPRAS